MAQPADDNNQDQTPVDFDLTCWYLNQRRTVELVGAQAVASGLDELGAIGAADDHLYKLAQLATLKDLLVGWLHTENPPTLGQLLITDTLNTNSPFTIYTNFYCRGLPKVVDAIHKNADLIPLAEAYAKLDDLRSGWRVSFPFHHEHLTSTSAWPQLSGQKTLFALGAVTEIKNKTIKAIPWVIGNPIPNFRQSATLVGTKWHNRLEIFIDDIDSFAKVQKISIRQSKKDLERLHEIPEQKVKEAFAEIIGEPTIPKDWGGERSDLFTSRVVIDEKRLTAAFAFKGKSYSRPLTMVELGKNGDQIDRLYTEPAEFLVLQHCHEITPPVRSAMRAYAQQIGNPRLFCLINGYDTVRLFKAYNKCGF